MGVGLDMTMLMMKRLVNMNMVLFVVEKFQEIVVVDSIAYPVLSG